MAIKCKKHSHDRNICPRKAHVRIDITSVYKKEDKIFDKGESRDGQLFYVNFLILLYEIKIKFRKNLSFLTLIRIF
jgi:hypothetical protein